MTEDISKNKLDSILYNFFVNSFGTSQKFTFSLVITLIIGIIYSFKMPDQHILLFVFGMFLPAVYIIGVYRMFKANKIILEEETPTAKMFRNKYGNSLFMIIDISITLLIGFLIYFDFLDFLFFRILSTIILPIIYQLIIKFFITLQ